MRPFFYGATPGGPSMPHMGYHHYYRGGRGRPLRLFWFAIGAVSAVAWINHREKKAITAANSNGSPWEAQPQGGQGWGHGFGHGHGHGRGRKWDREEADSGSRMDYGGQRPMESSGPVAAPAPAPSHQAPVAPAPVAPPMQSEAIQPQADQRWVDDREKVKEIARQASETMSELSEATLDSMLAGLQSLKNRMAERRATQEQQTPQEQQPAAQSPPPPPTPRHWV
ncbi:uncharacterized protein STEHIDRAFT_111279 [Stereum hirsutum FP-91666 SS1]|uniref:uncharacterized protein n=1 Tax=Stereum hirsutum (strain FP-91666) TaxID=721885 RepID=UPI00044492E5|nr:uncharacterized protein STEHIDRAFT_111279 [Stereum hirsutum FP-91666 SS1]EIM86869.1 hypothetical protein STEHIDRAFT_111279 [Stereum hirsutum FP-91666 SS1]